MKPIIWLLFLEQNIHHHSLTLPPALLTSIVVRFYITAVFAGTAAGTI